MLNSIKNNNHRYCIFEVLPHSPSFAGDDCEATILKFRTSNSPELLDGENEMQEISRNPENYNKYKTYCEIYDFEEN